MHPGCQNTFPLRLIDRTLDFGDLLPCRSCPAKGNATGSENIIHMRTALARLLVAEKLQRVQNFLLDERFCTNGHCFAQAPFQSLRGCLCFQTTCMQRPLFLQSWHVTFLSIYPIARGCSMCRKSFTDLTTLIALSDVWCDVGNVDLRTQFHQ